LPDPFSPLARLAHLHEIWRQRQQLLELDGHLLAAKPFWI
jgi:hypothetical protein